MTPTERLVRRLYGEARTAFYPPLAEQVVAERTGLTVPRVHEILHGA